MLYELGNLFGILSLYNKKEINKNEEIVKSFYQVIESKKCCFDFIDVIEINLPIQIENNFLKQQNNFSYLLINNFKKKHDEKYMSYLEKITKEIIDKAKNQYPYYYFSYENHTIYISLNKIS